MIKYFVIINLFCLFLSCGGVEVDCCGTIGGGTKTTISPSGGNYTTPIEITISCVCGEAIYTTDGSEPSKTNGIVFEDPFTINETTTIKAFRYSEGSKECNAWEGDIITEEYIFPK